MKLPYAEAIRDARARSEQVQAAVMLLTRVRTAAHAVSILLSQVEQGTDYRGALPGEEELAEAVAQLPEFSTLNATVPGSIATQLKDRADRLQQVMAALAPLAEQSQAIAAELHELQHDQYHALEKPEYADVVAELWVLANKRDALAKRMTDVREKQAMVDPVTGLLHGLIPPLTAQVTATEIEPDEQGIIAWGAARLAQQQLVGMAKLLIRVGLVVQLPFEPMVPDQPHPRHRERLIKETIVVLTWMRQLYDTLGERGDALAAQLAELDEQHRAAEDVMKERMG